VNPGRRGLLRVVIAMHCIVFAACTGSPSAPHDHSRSPPNAVALGKTMTPTAVAPPTRHFDPNALRPILDEALPHTWRDPNVGAAIASGFPRDSVERLLGPTLVESVATLHPILPAADLSKLAVHLHARPAVDVAGVKVNAVHRDGAVHVFAANADGSLSDTARAHLRHELVHAFLHLTGRRPARWLDEGLAQVLSNLAIGADGSLEPLPREDFVAIVAVLCAAGNAPTAAELLDSTLDYPDAERVGAFYIASWSLTQHALSTFEGPLSARVDRILQTSRPEWTALGEDWKRDLATTDAAAAWSRFAARSVEGRSQRYENALATLPPTEGWYRALDALAHGTGDAPIRAGRLLRHAPAEARYFALVRKLLHGGVADVRRAVARSLYANETWLRDGTEQLRALRADPAATIPATLALALAGDRDMLAEWLKVHAHWLDRSELVDALLALKRVLPDAAPLRDANRLLDAALDPNATIDDLEEYVEASGDRLQFDVASNRYLETEVAECAQD
jgi:hypothetical protein